MVVEEKSNNPKKILVIPDQSGIFYSYIQSNIGFEAWLMTGFSSFKKFGDTVGQPSLRQISPSTGYWGTHS
jgi:hypothetical protein